MVEMSSNMDLNLSIVNETLNTEVQQCITAAEVYHVEPLTLAQLSTNKLDDIKSEQTTKLEDLSKSDEDFTLSLCDSGGSTPSEGTTPRDEDLSSGSPSPVPDENGILEKEKPKVRLGKDISLMMQALNSLNSPEEKIAALCKKYADLLESNKILQKKLRAVQRKQSPMIAERCQLQADLSKALAMKTRIENVARELQSQKKVLQKEYDDTIVKMKRQQEVLCGQFKSNLEDVSKRMDDLATTNKSLCSQNHNTEKQIQSIVKEYQTREEHLKAITKNHVEENELLKLKLEKSELLLQTQHNKHVDDQLENAKIENELRKQLLVYSGKFEDFEGTLKKSNSVFSKLMEKISMLEKSEIEYEAKAVQLSSEQKKMMKKSRRLESLCRALQNERNDLVEKVKAYELVQKSTPKISQNPKKAEKLMKRTTNNNKKNVTECGDTKVSSTVKTIDDEQNVKLHVLPCDQPTGNKNAIKRDVRELLSDVVDRACNLASKNSFSE